MTAEPAVPKQWDRSEGARRDIVAGGIVVAAILLFIGNGGAVMQSVIRTLSGLGGGTDRMLAVALILKIALLLFGWRRYVDRNREVRERTEADKGTRRLDRTHVAEGTSEHGVVHVDGRRIIKKKETP